MDVDTVLLSVQERDNWRRRLALLEQTLREVRSRRDRVEARVKRLRKALHQMERSRGVRVDGPSRVTPKSAVHGSDLQIAPR